MADKNTPVSSACVFLCNDVNMHFNFWRNICQSNFCMYDKRDMALKTTCILNYFANKHFPHVHWISVKFAKQTNYKRLEILWLEKTFDNPTPSLFLRAVDRLKTSSKPLSNLVKTQTQFVFSSVSVDISNSFFTFYFARWRLCCSRFCRCNDISTNI